MYVRQTNLPRQEEVSGSTARTVLVATSIFHTHFPDARCDGLNMLGPGSGIIEGCGLVGVGVALLEEVCHDGGL